MKKITIKNAGFLLVFALMSIFALQSNATEVTFRVDMSNETVSPLGVHVAGSFQGWDPATTELTLTFGGVYVVTVDIPEGTDIEYKFVNGNAWGMDESVPEGCGIFSGGSYNRYLTVPADPVVLPVVCYGGCNPCSFNVDVTFQVDMSEQTVTSGVFLAGQFNGWNSTAWPMNDLGNGVWARTVFLEPGTTWEYKFVNSGSWETVSGSCVQNENRYILVPDEDIVLEAPCFGSCIPCAVPTVAITFQVDMEYIDVSPSGVFLAGSFNDWDPTEYEMTSARSGVYEITLDLSEGDYIEYRYYNGNTAGDTEIVPQECSQNNARFLEIPFENTTLDAVCFGQCGPCGEPPVDVQITFQVDMSEQSVSPEGVHIAGTFQGWDPADTPMIDAGGGIYTYTATFQSGYYDEYKFVNGATWDGAEFVPEECAFNQNRYIYIPDVNTTLDLVCFSGCEACPPPPEWDITFQVDMSNETVSADGIHLSASFNDFDPAATPMADMGNGVYAVTVSLTQGDYQMYRFVNGNTFEGFETVPAECSQEDGLRELTVPNQATTLPEICFGECDLCVPLPKSMVTFQVDMTTEIVAAEGVHLVGSFQGWDPATTILTDNGNGIWSLTLELVEGVHHTYKFVNGNIWDGAEFVPEECGEDDGSGNFNRYFDVPVDDLDLDLVCFGMCTLCPPPVEVTFQVDMSNETVSEFGVHIAGDFQGWDAAGTPMIDAGDGVYTYTTTLFEGLYYEYKFINGNTWDDDETVPAGCAEGGNRFLTAPDVATTLELVCFGSCTICVPPTVEITFQVDMSNETVSPDGIHIAGDFQGWEPGLTLMQDAGGGIYTYTAILNVEEYYEYKFVNGNTWEGYENIYGDCTQNDNRFLTVPDVNTTLDVDCFSWCGPCPDLISVTFQVDMALEEVSVDDVYLVGSFQGWVYDATPMADAGGGIYSVELILPATSYHTYKFVNGNTWPGQEIVPEECGVDDGFGTFNRFIEVPLENTILEVVCFSGCSSCTQQHIINLPAGWSGFSSWVMPDETDIEALLNQIYPELIILQTMEEMYYPSEDINTIGTWDSQSAYKIKVSEDVTLNITGYPEQNKTLQLKQGWNLIPAISAYPVDVVDLFSGVSDKVVVVKDIAGTGVYWLEFNINTIVNLVPGKAYFVLMNEAGEITFP